jgi:hypothetical protein
MVFEIVGQGLGKTPIAGMITDVAGDRTFDLRAIGLFVVGIHAGIA